MAFTESIEDSWDIIITPKTGLFDLKLKELWHYRDLLWLWVRRQYVGAYKQTLMGPLWHFISPIFATLSYMFLFGKVANISTGGVPMFLFYSAGIAIWNFFYGCFSSSSSAFSANAGIFGKVYFPRLIMPLASIVSSLIKFGIQFSLLVVAYLYFIFWRGYHPAVNWHLIYIPVSLLFLALTGFGMGIIISCGYHKVPGHQHYGWLWNAGFYVCNTNRLFFYHLVTKNAILGFVQSFGSAH